MRVEIDVLYLRILFTSIGQKHTFGQYVTQVSVRFDFLMVLNGRFDCAINLASEAINFVFTQCAVCVSVAPVQDGSGWVGEQRLGTIEMWPIV